jgi:DNA polymerase-1
MATVALIDGDILVYIACAAVASDFGFDFDDEEALPVTANLGAARQIVDARIRAAMEDIGATHVRVALSDRDSNWRKSVMPEYKANRAAKDKPPGFSEVRAYIKKVYKGLIIPTLEADDILGIWMTGKHIKGDKVIVSIDKDMLSIPGKVYNPDHPDRGVVEVSRAAADRFHLEQTLMGDSVDNYKGIPGVGPKKTAKILDAECSWAAVVAAYEAAGLDEAEALRNARVARILRRGEYTKNKGVYLWRPTKKYTIYGRPKDYYARRRQD